MNSVTLRIRGSGNNKTRGGITFEAITLPDNYNNINNEIFQKFTTLDAEAQLAILKQILSTLTETCNPDSVKFLVDIYLNADIKHPAKCMITRYVTKNDFIQSQFSTILTQELDSLISKQWTGHKSCIEVVCKLGSCTENFPTGADAVRNLETPLAGYLRDCLASCISALSDTKPLSPTEKNEIFNLAHSTLRLLLYLIQRVKEKDKLIHMFQDIRASLKRLMFDGDAPMDTKSVCGILYVYMHTMENGPDSSMDILNTNQKDQDVVDMLENESSQLSLYSAIATVIPTAQQHSHTVDGVPAVVRLTDNILEIGERSSAESTIILGVTRTLVQICKGLDQSRDSGLRLLDSLFVFVWSHLEHYTDSVQHLTAQALGHIVQYCAKLRRDGDESAMSKLLSALTSLDRARKSFYISVTHLSNELGADAVMEIWPRVVEELLCALSVQAVQASATTALETLLRHDARRSSSDVIHARWVRPIVEHVASRELHSAELHILENLLSLAAKLDPGVMNYILPYIKTVCSGEVDEIYKDVKRVLMLLSVARKAGALAKLTEGSDGGDRWRDVISYEVLNMAAVDFKQENRILSISLVVESPKSTEPFAPRELDFVLHFVKYNMNCQSPHFRQLLLSIMKKFIKRLENSYKVLVRENSISGTIDKGEYYVRFVRDLRALCLHGLVKGANYSRRHVALQILAWLDQMQDGLGPQDRVWTEDEVETLLQHLEDSYEVNKALALQLLTRCPDRLLKETKYSTSLEFEDILTQASSVKPTDCVTAVYKLRLLRTKLPHSIVQGVDSASPNRVKFALLNRLLSEARRQLSVCQQSIVYGARSAPMYGVLHCIGHTLEPGAPFGIPPDELTAVLQSLVDTCVAVCGCAGAVLASAAPEGLLPEVTPRSATADPAAGSIRLEDGGEVTAQMVLLCAWRSVKEVSLILSTVVNQLLTYDEIEPATLRYDLVKRIGELFTSLLTETKHRGAFEQVYVGFTRLLTSLWRSSNPEFNELPKAWLRELMAAIESGDSNGRLCATRRSAGLPFMIQALVITELQVKVNSKSFDSCMSTLLRLARSSHCSETRCHCLNILRALYRNSQLDEIVGTYVGEGLMVALLGFESGTWIERNSATLLFSALVVRVFGVQRSRDSERLCVRNRMTGRIFFLRYPQLYDFMLNKLKQVSDDGKEQLLHPSLYPILLLLARLYPSSLEGTVSNLKLATFVPLVVRCAGAATLHTRRLAANAVAPLVPPDRYISHVESMMELLCDATVKRNFCHGILLQVLKLLDSRPENLAIDEKSQQHLRLLFVKSLWILAQCSGTAPCYVIADEYIKIINVLIWKFDSLLEDTFMNEIQKYLKNLIFNKPEATINPGRQLCLSNAVYLYLTMCNKYSNISEMRRFVYQCLTHPIYEVVLAMLNYLLILYGKLDIENPLQQHLYELSKINVDDFEEETRHTIVEKNKVNFPSEKTEGENYNIILNALKEEPKYVEILCKILKSNKYLECTQKCLRLITLEPNTQVDIVKAKEGCDNDIKDAKTDIVNIKDELKHNFRDITKDETRLNSTINMVKDKKGFLRAQTGITKDEELISDLIISRFQTQNTRISDDIIMDKLIDSIENEHENLTHIYLASFCNFLTSRIREHQIESEKLLDALRVIFTYSLSDNDCETRNVVVDFLEKNLEKLLSGVYLEQLNEENQFELKATSWATAVTMLEDDDESVRSRASRVITNLPSLSPSSSRFHHHHVVPSKAADVLLETVQNDQKHAAQLLSVLALLDFRAEVCMNDDVNDECRVFDQNERYNINLEETILSRACACAVRTAANISNSHINDSITSAPYRRTFDRLCGDNIAAYTKLVNGEKVNDVNPKVEIFYNTLLDIL